MVRGLDGFFFNTPAGYGWYSLWRCVVLKDREDCEVSHFFPVALARGKHLFPFRTEQLSPSAPMVLGSQGPGRVGRRRFFLTRAAFGRLVVVDLSSLLAGWPGWKISTLT
jgi:hypothetical protein